MPTLQTKRVTRSKAVTAPTIVIIGRVSHFDAATKLASIDVLTPVRLGDIIRVKGRTMEHVQPVTAIWRRGKPVSSADREQMVSITMMEPVDVGAIVQPCHDS